MHEKLKIHSTTDLITNSSTTIFTFSDGCDAVLREMINEILRVFGIDKKCDDLFHMVVLADDDYHYLEYDNTELSTEEIREQLRAVKNGEMPKPEWFNTVESHVSEELQGGTTLYISPKNPEYEKMAQLIYKFLYSTSNEATYD